MSDAWAGCSEPEGYCGPEAWGGRFIHSSTSHDENDHLAAFAEHVVGEWTWTKL